MAKVVAKAKAKKRRQIEAEAKADADVVVVERTEATPKPGVTFKEMQNVIADSLERLWEEMGATRGMHNIRLNAEEGAYVIAGSLMHGVGQTGAPVRIKEAEQNFKFCKEHK